ncbi:MAG: NifB/NifX family molybdenum-iron cluster-binding protein [Candidatus Marinimicrobia bacterium]|nr:NifB/NifX family molybdenum-iron cluster-binding protein [Candidatus Neomarinimicrobiota bacterium]MBL7022962.1 NifB/NifX family molybdenum-iron cluster-binding protein [Candidatus Neomarinimicrobiota bacterium]MBL7108780.1 NifB/NifX family molybdenum-iron cluster-binding protein [Candidatus Neomarinimicrobiota bacterium]
MKNICIPAEAPELTSKVDNHFGHPNWFLIVNENGELVHKIVGDEKSHHAKIFARAEELGFDSAVTFHMGPGAFNVAVDCDVKIFLLEDIPTVLEAIDRHKDGKTTLLTSGEGLSCGGNCGH